MLIRPCGLSGFGSRVYDVLEQFTVSPWNLLKNACRGVGINPLELEADGFAPVLSELQDQLARMTDDEHGAALAAQLQSLL